MAEEHPKHIREYEKDHINRFLKWGWTQEEAEAKLLAEQMYGNEKRMITEFVNTLFR